MSNAHEYAERHAERFLDELFDLLRIPSVSTDPAYRDDIRRAAGWVAANMTRIGLDSTEVLETNGHPVVYGEWSGAPEGAPTVLVYGHYDVQPAAMEDGWTSDPFEPRIADGRIVARGATDDKGQMVAQLKAAESLLASGSCPVNLKYLIEGEEECGSTNLEAFVRENRERLAADVCVISDTGMESMDRPSMCYGLRGMVLIEVVVSGPLRDLHSGMGGPVHNPAQALAEIVAKLHDEEGRITVPGFYDEVATVPDEERAMLARGEPAPEFWENSMGDLPEWGEPGYSLGEKMGIRPTLEINGIAGGYSGEGFKTVLPARAIAKISCRLVPDQDPLVIFERLRDHILSLAPDTVRVEVDLVDTGAPALTDVNHPAMQAAVRAFEHRWPGQEVLLLRGGGSIPVVSTLKGILGLPVILLGFGLADCGAHGPDENFPVEMFGRAIDTIIRFMTEVA